MSTDVVQLTQELVRFPCLAGAEQPLSDYLCAQFKALGFDQVVQDDYGSVYGCIGPADAPIALLFDGHMDVVPVVGEWTVDPFGGEIRGDRLYGRGSTDMKGGLAAAIAAVANTDPARLQQRIAVSASVLEEQIEGMALARVLEALAPEAVVICEPSDLKIKTGQKGRLEIELCLEGQPAHAATPEKGESALLKAARALELLEALTPPEHPELGKGILVATDIISDPYPSISMLPRTVTIRFDRRSLPGENATEILAAIERCLLQGGVEGFSLKVSDSPIRTYTGLEVPFARDLPSWQLDSAHPLLERLQQAVRAQGLDTTASMWPFCTNGSESAGRRGIPTIGFGPGVESDAHIIDESISVSQLRQAEAVYRGLIMAMAG